MVKPADAFSGGPGYHGPGQVRECPYVLTGNADESWQDFFVLAWAFGEWASTEDVSGAGPSIRMHVKELMCGPANDRHTEEEDGKIVASGLTLWLSDACWAADVFLHFAELLVHLPNGLPDGEFELHFPSNSENDIVLNLWHD